MATLQTQLQKAKRITPQKVSNDLFNYIRSLEALFEAYNRATLHEDSQDVNKKPIGFYSFATELITGGRKAKGQPFDLFETGDFLNQLFAKVGKDNIFFDTTDSKKQEVLSNLLTDNIFGLQDEDLQQIIESRIKPFMQRYARQSLGV